MTQAITPSFPPHNMLPSPNLPYHVLLEERHHYVGQIQRLQAEKDAALTRNAGLIALLRSEKAKLESELKAQRSLVCMKEEEVITLRKELLEATGPPRISLPNPIPEALVPPLPKGQLDQCLVPPLPPQDRLASLCLGTVPSSSEEPALYYQELEGCIPMDETKHSPTNPSTQQLTLDPNSLDPTTPRALERVPNPKESTLMGSESPKQEHTSMSANNITPIFLKRI
ncbi:hypothetical protein M407DRAFT_6067 [Tulasnella calospora MUT 4182]|uniref:Uncharacterized protein n=1 Tax=Tulasnella calospora MUT 4182 TaxID=1051891 RepID=A0A0C3QQ73_9AGAM|nr:hypothetical protein M407DRAFT_6067 [Tulasnella calospora MUT 4182]